MITTHTQLLNALAEKYGLQNYLEIGINNPANNFDKIKCQYKQGVDPEVIRYEIMTMTSDSYFDELPNYVKFDLIFIDGLHHADQVKRDFENSLKYLSDTGFIVIHDVLPENEAGTKVPRETKQWWGDVYKWAMRIREYDGIEFVTYNIDNGCMVINKKPALPGFKLNLIFDWSLYVTEGRTLMNVTDEVSI